MTTATEVPVAFLRTTAPNAGYDQFGVLFVAPAGSVLPLTPQHLYYREQGPGALHDLLDAGGITTTATVITVTADPALTSSRILAAGTDITITDGGAQAPITVALSAPSAALLTAVNSGPFVMQATTPGVPQSRTLTAGTDITITDGGAQGALTVSLNAATAGLITSLNTAPIVVEATTAGLPQSRTLTAGAGVTLTDGGAQGPLTIGLTVATTVASATMTFTFTPVPASIGNSNSFSTQTWNFTKVGTIVSASVPASGGFNGGSLGFSSITATGIPAGFQPVSTTICPQGSQVGVGSVPGISAFSVSGSSVSTEWTSGGNWPVGGGSGWMRSVLQWSTV